MGVGQRRNAPGAPRAVPRLPRFQTAVLRTRSRVAGNARKTHVEAARTAEKPPASAARGQRVASEAIPYDWVVGCSDRRLPRASDDLRDACSTGLGQKVSRSVDRVN